MKLKSKILVILGPTSTGKTDLALQLANKFQGELVACDSRQVYMGLDIGTGKMPGDTTSHPELDSGSIKEMPKQVRHDIKRDKGYWELNGVKIWMYDVADPEIQYTVADYVNNAEKLINDIKRRGKLPIIVGGTGLYLKALLGGLSYLAVPIDLKLREKLSKLSLEQLQKKLQRISPQKWENMNNSDRQNSRRLVRAIEIVILSGTKDLPRMWDSNELRDSSLIVQNDRRTGQDDILKIGLTAPREILYQRIDERVISRIKQGMIDEAKKLHKNGLTFKRMRQLGLEYGVLADFLQSRIETENQLIKIMQNKIHGFARHQITWFKKEKSVFWFDITDINSVAKVENLVAKWYDNLITYATKN